MVCIGSRLSCQFGGELVFQNLLDGEGDDEVAGDGGPRKKFRLIGNVKDIEEVGRGQGECGMVSAWKMD